MIKKVLNAIKTRLGGGHARVKRIDGSAGEAARAKTPCYRRYGIG
jgi:hypothetical protein